MACYVCGVYVFGVFTCLVRYVLCVMCVCGVLCVRCAHLSLSCCRSASRCAHSSISPALRCSASLVAACLAWPSLSARASASRAASRERAASCSARSRRARSRARLRRLEKTSEKGTGKGGRQREIEIERKNLLKSTRCVFARALRYNKTYTYIERDRQRER